MSNKETFSPSIRELGECLISWGKHVEGGLDVGRWAVVFLGQQLDLVGSKRWFAGAASWRFCDSPSEEDQTNLHWCASLEQGEVSAVHFLALLVDHLNESVLL